MTAPGWKLWLSLAGTSLALSGAGVVVSIRIAESNTAEQINAAQAAAVESRRVTCALAGSVLDGYKAEPPPTDAGREQAARWLDQYRILGCLPSR